MCNYGVWDGTYLVYADTKGWINYGVWDGTYLVYADTKGWVTKNSPALTNIYSHCLSFSIYKPKQYQSLYKVTIHADCTDYT